MDILKYQDREKKLINGYTVYSSRKYSRSFSNDFSSGRVGQYSSPKQPL
jgi:hypothetical protein